MTPDLVIFRIPSTEEEGLLLVQVDFDGEEMVGDGRIFTTAGPDDWYSETEFHHVILAQKIEGGSINAIRFFFGFGETFLDFYKLDFEDMNALVQKMVVEYEKEEFEESPANARITYN